MRCFSIVAGMTADRTVAAVAAALDEMKSRNSIPKLREALDDKDPATTLAAAHSLHLMHDGSAYWVYHEVRFPWQSSHGCKTLAHGNRVEIDIAEASGPIFQQKWGGTEIPVKVTGTKSEPHFGTDFGHKD